MSHLQRIHLSSDKHTEVCAFAMDVYSSSVFLRGVTLMGEMDVYVDVIEEGWDCVASDMNGVYYFFVVANEELLAFKDSLTKGVLNAVDVQRYV